MEGPKSRPNIIITTYSASNSAYLQQTYIDKQTLQENKKRQKEGATRSDSSTNFFRNQTYQTKGSQQQAEGAGAKNRILADLSQIRGPTGSVRGHKDVVRKSLEGIKVAYHNRYIKLPSSSTSASSSLLSFSTFFANQTAKNVNSNPLACDSRSNRRAANLSSSLTLDSELYCSEYMELLMEEEQNLCVAYTTTLGVIRRTFEDSKMLKSILDLNLVRYEERDIFLNQEYKHQLKMRSGSIVVPAFFVDGQYMGGAKELEAMNESGQLQKTLARFKMPKASQDICSCCGNARFIACQSCHGSRKSTIHHFKFNSIALRCIKCDQNDGLVQCPVCTSKSLFCEQIVKRADEEAKGAAVTVGEDEKARLSESMNRLDGCKSNEQVDLNNNC